LSHLSHLRELLLKELKHLTDDIAALRFGHTDEDIFQDQMKAVSSGSFDLMESSVPF